jgi:NAD(P)-dependent dehydrogenase (short-subunit alcohol dehydrogenase family)
VNSVVVTGAAGGIGRALVAGLLEQEYSVLALDSNADALGRLPEHERVSRVALDVTDSRAVDDVVDAVVRRDGPPFGLVNLAGNNRLGRVEETSDEDWRFLVDANLSSTFYLCRSLVPPMCSAGRGRIINVSSIQGLRGCRSNAAYAAVKAGIIGLTRAIATDCAASGVTVNAVAPVVTLTERVRRTPGLDLDLQLSTIPMGRAGKVQDVTATVLFLLSDAASFFTGQTLSPNGGDVMP